MTSHGVLILAGQRAKGHHAFVHTPKNYAWDESPPPYPLHTYVKVTNGIGEWKAYSLHLHGAGAIKHLQNAARSNFP